MPTEIEIAQKAISRHQQNLVDQSVTRIKNVFHHGLVEALSVTNRSAIEISANAAAKSKDK